MSQSICSHDSSENSNIQSNLQTSKPGEANSQMVSPKNNQKLIFVSNKSSVDEAPQRSALLLARQLEDEVSTIQLEMEMNEDEAGEELLQCLHEILNISGHILSQHIKADDNKFTKMDNMRLLLAAQNIRFGLIKSRKSKKLFSFWRQCLELLIELNSKGLEKSDVGSDWSKIIKEEKTVKVEMSVKEVCIKMKSTVRNLAKTIAREICFDHPSNMNFQEQSQCAQIGLEIQTALIQLEEIMSTDPNQQKILLFQDIRTLLSAERLKYGLIRQCNSKESFSAGKVSLLLLLEIIQSITSEYSKVPTKSQKSSSLAPSHQ